MKYIEELCGGDCFVYNTEKFLITTDFRKNGSRLAYSLTSGSPHWFNSQEMIEIDHLYTIDKDNNIISVKQCQK